jgi:hypothetical protein
MKQVAYLERLTNILTKQSFLRSIAIQKIVTFTVDPVKMKQKLTY